MVRKCVVCKENEQRNSTLSFHRFPVDKERRKMWLQACRLKEADMKDIWRVCSKHFRNVDYTLKDWPIRKLLPTVVPAPSNSYFELKKKTMIAEKIQFSPTIIKIEEDSNICCFTASSDYENEENVTIKLEDVQSQEENISKTQVEATVISDTNHSQKTRELENPRYPCDLTVSHFSTPRKAKQSLDMIIGALENERKKVKVLKVQKTRLQKKIDSFKTLLENLYDSKLISEETSRTMMVSLKCKKESKHVEGAKSSVTEED